MKPGQWKQICGELVTRLDEYSDALLWNIRSFQQIGDNQGAEIIQSSCVGCLAHLAVLCDLVSRSEPNFDPEMDAICDSSLERLGRLTQEMKFERYSYFDLLLRVRHSVDPPWKVRELIRSLIRFRGKSHWSPSIHGSVNYLMGEVHPCDIVGRSLQGRCQTSKPTFQTRLLRRSTRSWSSSTAGRRGRDIQTLWWLRRG